MTQQFILVLNSSFLQEVTLVSRELEVTLVSGIWQCLKITFYFKDQHRKGNPTGVHWRAQRCNQTSDNAQDSPSKRSRYGPLCQQHEDWETWAYKDSLLKGWQVDTVTMAFNSRWLCLKKLLSQMVRWKWVSENWWVPHGGTSVTDKFCPCRRHLLGLPTPNPSPFHL